MDNSSRNIVKFIGAITVAALLIMAARFYADSQKTEVPAEVPEKAVAPEPAPAAAPDPAIEEDQTDSETEVVEEDAQLIMGEPSINLEQGGSPDYGPTAQSEAPSKAAVQE